MVAFALLAASSALGQEAPTPLDLEAQQVIYEEKYLKAQGDVVLQQGEMVLSGGCISYDRTSGWIDADQEILLERPDITVAAPKGRYRPEDHTGDIERASGAFHAIDDIYFKVDRLDLGRELWTLSNPWITTCDPEHPVWALRASSAEVDPDHALTLRNMRFELGGVPVVYLPWLRTTLQPRDSGMLFPVFSSGNRRGSEIAWPLYWSTSPWLDITYTPHWMSRLGWGHEGEMRLAQPGDGMLLLRGFLLDDGGTTRFLKGWEQQIQGQGWSWETRGEVLSDVAMASDFVLPLQRDTTGQYSLQTATLSGAGGWGSGNLYVNHRQDLTTGAQGGVVSDSGMMWSTGGIADPGALAWNLEVGERRWYAPQRVDLTRWQVIPRIGQSHTWSGITAQWQAQGWLGRFREQNGRIFQQAIPAVSADLLSGFERVFRQTEEKGWNRLRHRIQPHIQAVWIPHADQSNLPTQESGNWQLDWSNIWALNRYAGEDRINGAQRITLGLSQSLDGGYGPIIEHRIQRWGAVEILRSFEASPDTVLSGTVGSVDRWSPWFVRLTLGSGTGWSAGGDIRWNSSGAVVDRHRMVQWRGDVLKTRLSESWVPSVRHAWMWSGAAMLTVGTLKARYEWDPEGAGFLGAGISWRGDFGCWAVGAVVERLRLLDGGEERRIGFGVTLLGLGGGADLPELSGV